MCVCVCLLRWVAADIWGPDKVWSGPVLRGVWHHIHDSALLFIPKASRVPGCYSGPGGLMLTQRRVDRPSVNSETTSDKLTTDSSCSGEVVVMSLWHVAGPLSRGLICIQLPWGVSAPACSLYPEWTCRLIQFTVNFFIKGIITTEIKIYWDDVDIRVWPMNYPFDSCTMVWTSNSNLNQRLARTPACSVHLRSQAGGVHWDVLLKELGAVIRPPCQTCYISSPCVGCIKLQDKIEYEAITIVFIN